MTDTRLPDLYVVMDGRALDDYNLASILCAYERRPSNRELAEMWGDMGNALFRCSDPEGKGVLTEHEFLKVIR